MSARVRSAIENGLIVVGILMLWPWVFGCRSVWYLALSVIVLVALGALAVLRLLRVKRALEAQNVRAPDSTPDESREQRE